MDKNQKKQLIDVIEQLTHHLTTSLGEVVEVLGQISESVDRIRESLEVIEKVL